MLHKVIILICKRMIDDNMFEDFFYFEVFLQTFHSEYKSFKFQLLQNPLLK